VVHCQHPPQRLGNHLIASKQHHTPEWSKPASGGADGAASMNKEVRASVFAALFENVDSDDGRARNDPLWGKPQTAFRERVRVPTFPPELRRPSGRLFHAWIDLRCLGLITPEGYYSN
jgi:hypothetical protein